jgi:hypothetical protein
VTVLPNIGAVVLDVVECDNTEIAATERVHRNEYDLQEKFVL